MIDKVYAELRRLRRFDYLATAQILPSDGVYVVFEPAEVVVWRGMEICRVTRVGINRVDGRLAERIRKHYGNPDGLGGDRRQNVFRRHVGAALLRMENPEHPQLGPWLGRHGQFPEHEAKLSTWLREHTCCRCIRVQNRDERHCLERGLIALFAQCRLGEPSCEWLGHYASDENVVRSGLWNSHHVDAQPLTEAEFDLLRHRIDETLGELGD